MSVEPVSVEPVSVEPASVEAGTLEPGRPGAAAAIWRWKERAGERGRQAGRQRIAGAVRAGIAFLVGGGMLWLGRPLVASVALGIGGLTLLLALASPLGAYAALDRLVLAAGRAVGRGLTWLLLAPFYYLVLTPLALLIRRRRDPLSRRLDPDAPSYWSKRDGARPIDRPY